MTMGDQFQSLPAWNYQNPKFFELEKEHLCQGTRIERRRLRALVHAIDKISIFLVHLQIGSLFAR
jgi:hypothetical protein